MLKGKELLNKQQFNLTLRRLCNELLENYGDFEDTCIVGIQPRGIILSERIRQLLLEEDPTLKFDYGLMDITFHRDDFRLRTEPLQPYPTQIDFSTEQKNVILVDDVLYSGRTIQAALASINHYGRPNKVELLTLVNRRFNRHLPIQADYLGIQVDAVDEAYVRVVWDEQGIEESVRFYSAKEKN